MIEKRQRGEALGSRVQDEESKVQCLGLQGVGVELQIQELGFMFQSSELAVFRLARCGCRVQGAVFRVEGTGLIV